MPMPMLVPEIQLTLSGESSEGQYNVEGILLLFLFLLLLTLLLQLPLLLPVLVPVPVLIPEMKLTLLGKVL